MNIGEYIYCHTTGKMNASNRVFAYKGQKYKVTERNINRIVFSSEVGEGHIWSLKNKESIDQFNKYFSIEPQIMIKHKIKNYQFKQ